MRLANGEIDLNAFQHRIYLQSEIDSYGYEIENIGNTFIIPLNLYSDKVKSVDELKDGDTVATPGRRDQRRPRAQGAGGCPASSSSRTARISTRPLMTSRPITSRLRSKS